MVDDSDTSPPTVRAGIVEIEVTRWCGLIEGNVIHWFVPGFCKTE